MQGLNKFHLLQFLSHLIIFSTQTTSSSAAAASSSTQLQNPLTHCAEIKIQPPLPNQYPSSYSSSLCKSDNQLYLRISIGLLEISSIDYENKRLSISKSLREGYNEVGTRISFDVPDHACDECETHGGDCPVGLECLCYPKKCRSLVITQGVVSCTRINPLINTQEDKVISNVGEVSRPCKVFFHLVLFFVVIGVLR